MLTSSLNKNINHLHREKTQQEEMLSRPRILNRGGQPGLYNTFARNISPQQALGLKAAADTSPAV